jgi:hypothetical protein
MSNNCCPPPEEESSCCSPSKDEQAACCSGPEDNRPGYKLWPFVCGWLDTQAGQIPQVATRLTKSDICGRWQMRWGLGRKRYSIAPGLYAIGTPTQDSPVLVTANYKMTFDIVRRDLHGYDAWLLVLDTKGVNVWCAAGKGTFGTEEIVRQVQGAKLEQVVSHRSLIVPQLGAPGVAAHEVARSSGFKVVYGPIRSNDLPDFLENGQKATQKMRRVNFNLADRLVLTPVELVNSWKHVLWSMLTLFILGGIGPQIFAFSAAWSRGSAAIYAALSALFIGTVIVPILLPWIPGRSFALKGALTGLLATFLGTLAFTASLNWLSTLALLLAAPAISSWFAMNFTGSSTFTSPSGVEKEMRQAIPAQTAALLAGGLCWIASAF